jgi:tetratricopeptide (TPR) repeat protein
MLSRGDVLGAERKFVEIADTVRKVKEKADVVEARAIFEAGKLAEERVDWRTANAHYARAARLQPNNWRYAQRAGDLAHLMGDYVTAASLDEAALSIATSEFGPEARETAIALNSLALVYQSLARYTEAEPLIRRAIEIDEKALGKDHPNVAIRYNNLASLLEAEGKYEQAEPLYRRAIEIGEMALGGDHPDVGISYNNLAGLLRGQGKYDQAEPFYRRSLEILQTKFGLDHPNTVKVRKNYDRLEELKKQNSGNLAPALGGRDVEGGKE